MPNSGRRGSRQSIEPKAVLEHRAPKASTPILHSRGVESKVGRAVHCAPWLVMQTQLLGRNPTVRALTGAATVRAHLGRRTPAAKMAARQIYPKAQRVSRARSPLRAGVSRADLASRARILPSAPLRARLRPKLVRLVMREAPQWFSHRQRCEVMGVPG